MVGLADLRGLTAVRDPRMVAMVVRVHEMRHLVAYLLGGSDYRCVTR